jgi:polar amino acid transport system substrate-binding protein
MLAKSTRFNAWMKGFSVPARETENMTGMVLNRRKAFGVLAGCAFAGGLAGRPTASHAASGTLERIKKEGVLRVGCEAAYVPFTYRDNSGKIIGYDVDLVAKFVEPLGITAEFIDTQWSGIIPALYAGRFEMIPGMSYTKERLERVLFSIPYADASQALLIRAEDKDKIKTIDDMAGKVLGIKLGSPGETLKDKLDARLKKERGSGFESVKTYDDHPAAYLALAQGTLDGVLNTVPTLSVVLRDRPGVYSIVYDVGGNNWHGYAFRKEDTDLGAFIDSRITELKASGELYSLQEKWFGFKMNVADKIPTFD